MGTAKRLLGFRQETKIGHVTKNKKHVAKNQIGNLMKKILVPFALTLTLVALTPAAFAVGSATNPLTLSATVINNCTISTTPVAFGNYDPLSGAVNNASGTVVITCTKNAAPSITLGNGLNFSANRRLTDGTNFMNYEIYKPPTTVAGAACTWVSPQRWGTVVGETFTPTAAPDKNPRTYNVCGQITAGQDLAAAVFNDTVVATVNF
jgi:spore coat protein U-like protein